MISQLTGNVVALGPNWVVLDVQGVGYRLTCTPTTAAALRPAEQSTLYTTLTVRQDSLSLNGFGTTAERDTFELLQTASGVGPKLALAVVSVLSPAQLVEAIRSEDLGVLTRVPGIGRKGAEKLIIELRDRVGALDVEIPDEPAIRAMPGHEAWREQVMAGLSGLGWSARDADAACEKVAALVVDDPQISLARLMRAALQSLARA